VRNRWVIFIVCLLHHVHRGLQQDGSRLTAFDTQEKALQHLKGTTEQGRLTQDLLERDLRFCVRNCWWDVCRYLISLSHSSSVEDGNTRLDAAGVVRQEVGRVRQAADSLIRILDRQHADIQRISCAFQWAQSPSQVFLSIKYSYKWNSPGALSLESEEVSISPRHFHFSGEGQQSHSHKRYFLDLDLYDTVSQQNSSWSFGSVGRLMVTLTKEKDAIWPRLTQSTDKIANMHVWWEMKERYESEVAEYEKKHGVLDDQQEEAANRRPTKGKRRQPKHMAEVDWLVRWGVWLQRVDNATRAFMAGKRGEALSYLRGDHDDPKGIIRRYLPTPTDVFFWANLAYFLLAFVTLAAVLVPVVCYCYKPLRSTLFDSDAMDAGRTHQRQREKKES